MDIQPEFGPQILLCLPLSTSGPVLIVVEGNGSLALDSRHVGPVVAGAGEQHVAKQRLDGCLAYQANEKQLLDDRGGDDAQGGQAEEETPEAVWLAGVLVPYILLQSALRLLLDALHMGNI